MDRHKAKVEDLERFFEESTGVDSEPPFSMGDESGTYDLTPKGMRLEATALRRQAHRMMDQARNLEQAANAAEGRA